MAYRKKPSVIRPGRFQAMWNANHNTAAAASSSSAKMNLVRLSSGFTVEWKEVLAIVPSLRTIGKVVAVPSRTYERPPIPPNTASRLRHWLFEGCQQGAEVS